VSSGVGAESMARFSGSEKLESKTARGLVAEAVNVPMFGTDVAPVRESIRRDRPLCDLTWTLAAAKSLGLEYSLRPPGRPRSSRVIRHAARAATIPLRRDGHEQYLRRRDLAHLSQIPSESSNVALGTRLWNPLISVSYGRCNSILQSIMRSSSPAEANVLPSGEKSTERTTSYWRNC
jgi:hypothetical protein